jgi:hypothetical protein
MSQSCRNVVSEVREYWNEHPLGVQYLTDPGLRTANALDLPFSESAAWDSTVSNETRVRVTATAPLNSPSATLKWRVSSGGGSHGQCS